MNRNGKHARPAAGAEPPFLVRQLHGLSERMDHLERRMEDLTADGSQRVLDRMHELEDVTRRQCNSLLGILNEKGESIDKKYKDCELLVVEAEAKCTNMELYLHRRGDKERQETTEVHKELHAVISAIDQQACSAVAELESKIQRTTDQINNLNVTVAEVHGFCERAEAAAAQAQVSVEAASRRQLASWMTSAELKEAVITRARSLQPGDQQQGQLAWCIHMAQEAASRSPGRQRGRSSSRDGHAAPAPTCSSHRGPSHSHTNSPWRMDSTVLGAARRVAPQVPHCFPAQCGD